jgi:hypothetical protein
LRGLEGEETEVDEELGTSSLLVISMSRASVIG